MICDLQPDRDPPPGACPVDAALAQMRHAAASTCGRDVMCRDGTRQVMAILDDLAAGRGGSGDLDLLADVGGVMAATAACGMTAGAARHLVDSLRDQAGEWDLHLRRKRCTSLTCTMSFTVYVDPDSCTGSGKCAGVCPVDAIAGGDGLVHVVDTAACTRCLRCVAACPTGAVRKAGPVKPRVPCTPVPVGSFVGGGAGGGMRRRRRGA